MCTCMSLSIFLNKCSYFSRDFDAGGTHMKVKRVKQALAKLPEGWSKHLCPSLLTNKLRNLDASSTIDIKFACALPHHLLSFWMHHKSYFLNWVFFCEMICKWLIDIATEFTWLFITAHNYYSFRSYSSPQRFSLLESGSALLVFWGRFAPSCVRSEST